MAHVQVDALVRLTHDLPMMWLARGDVGVVRSIWLSPADRFEVEFEKPGQSPVRVLLDDGFLEPFAPRPTRAGSD